VNKAILLALFKVFLAQISFYLFVFSRKCVAGRVTLTDVKEKQVKLTGEVLDLEDIGGMVDHAPLSLASQADIIVFTGGRQPRKGQVGMDVLTENKEYMQKVMT